MEDTSSPNKTSVTNKHHELQKDIETLMQKRAQHRKLSQWQEADAIKSLLLNEPYKVEIIDYADKPSVSIPVQKKILEKKWLEWREITVIYYENGSSEGGTLSCVGIHSAPPFVVATVDTPKYQQRISETKYHLEQVRQQKASSCCCCCCCSRNGKSCSFFHVFSKPEPCPLLDLESHPSIGVRGILFEGWRTILLPRLFQWSTRSTTDTDTTPHKNPNDISSFGGIVENQKNLSSFVWVAEDDIRFPFISNGGLCPHHIHQECQNLFDSNPDIDIVSLGHAWKDISKQQQQQKYHQDDEITKKNTIEHKLCADNSNDKNSPSSLLLNHLKKGGGVHGTTLLAIRYPMGAQRLLEALDNCAKKRQQITHLDQFLFHSTLHDLGVALSDPPLVGWAEVDHTLTKSGMGHRRKGGGRNAFLPPPPSVPRSSCRDDETDICGRRNSVVHWVKRKRIVQCVDESKW